MRQETNNEIDLLLRRLGRRQDTSASTDHLDADELSSYAENALPPAARVRYTEHLAECSRCRELVVQLSSSAGVVAAQDTAVVSAPSALSKFLASLFSPMVLRYAVPALGLVIVAAIGFIVSRQQSGTSSPVAQVTQQERAQAPVAASQPEPSAPAGVVKPAENSAPANRGTLQTDGESGAAPPPNAPPTVSSINAEVNQNAAARKVEEQPSPNETPAAPKPAVATAEVQKKLEAEEKKQKAEARVTVANEPPPATVPADVKKEETRTGSVAGRARGLSKSEPAAAADAGRPVGQRDDAVEKDKNDADIRTVAGRHFRKQGNIWIDTAYNSSRNAMDLTRGSEQYRVLVGDEPAIKKIADELDGEIIVVWKGHTYRIR